jgi:hypothetical protein
MNMEWLEVLLVVVFWGLVLIGVHLRIRADRRRGLRLPRGVECKIVPRQNASSEELKTLGEALDRWMAVYGKPSLTTVYGLTDLRRGELPQPLSIALESYLDDNLTQHGVMPPSGERRALRHQEILDKLGPMAASRAVYLRVHGAEQATASLREAIGPNLVEDIFIDQRSLYGKPER